MPCIPSMHTCKYECITYLCEMNGIHKYKVFQCSKLFHSKFIPKFLVNFCDKIRRAHTVLAISKM